MRICQELHLSVCINAMCRGGSVAVPHCSFLSEVCGFPDFPSSTRRAAPTGQTGAKWEGGKDRVETLACTQDFTKGKKKKKQLCESAGLCVALAPAPPSCLQACFPDDHVGFSCFLILKCSQGEYL